MTAEHFETTYRALLSITPFRPFTVELNTGQRYEIDNPRATAIRDGKAVLFAPGGVPVLFDHEGVKKISRHNCN